MKRQRPISLALCGSSVCVRVYLFRARFVAIAMELYIQMKAGGSLWYCIKCAETTKSFEFILRIIYRNLFTTPRLLVHIVGWTYIVHSVEFISHRYQAIINWWYWRQRLRLSHSHLKFRGWSKTQIVVARHWEIVKITNFEWTNDAWVFDNNNNAAIELEVESQSNGAAEVTQKRKPCNQMRFRFSSSLIRCIVP